MKTWKIMSAILAAAAIGSVAADSEAVQCDRYPDSGNAPFPARNRSDREDLSCSDGTRSVNSALTAPNGRQSTTTRLTAVGPSGRGRAQSVGFGQGSQNTCVSVSTTVNASDFEECSVVALSWFGFLRND